jgi:hypothetical protein
MIDEGRSSRSCRKAAVEPDARDTSDAPGGTLPSAASPREEGIRGSRPGGGERRAEAEEVGREQRGAQRQGHDGRSRFHRTGRRAARPDAGAAPAEAATEPRASIFTSIQKLGLKLESRKVSLDVIVVVHAEKTPTEN